MRPVRSFATVATLAIAGAVTASAQPIISAKSGVIAGVEGKVLLNNEEVQQSVTHFPEVKEGSVLRTEDGRVELMLPPGFMLRMGENGALKMLANRLIDTRVELQAGSAVVEVDQANQDFNVSIALKDGVVNLSKAGVYRFDSEPARVKVFHGLATVQIGDQNVMVARARCCRSGAERRLPRSSMWSRPMLWITGAGVVPKPWQWPTSPAPSTATTTTPRRAPIPGVTTRISTCTPTSPWSAVCAIRTTAIAFTAR